MLLLYLAVSCSRNTVDKQIEELGIELAKAKIKTACKKYNTPDAECQNKTNDIINISIPMRRKMMEDANARCKALNSSDKECTLLKQGVINSLEQQIKEEGTK